MVRKRIDDLFTPDQLDMIALYVSIMYEQYQLDYFKQFEKKNNIIPENNIVINKDNHILEGKYQIVQNLVLGNTTVQCQVGQTEMIDETIVFFPQEKYSMNELLFLQYMYWTHIRRTNSFVKLIACDNEKDNLDELHRGYFKLKLTLTNRGMKNLSLLLNRQEGHNGQRAHNIFLVVATTDINAENEIFSEQLGDNNIGILNVLLNENSMHLLNYGLPYKYKGYQKKLKEYLGLIKSCNFNYEDFVIASSGILGIYGMRNPTDIDIVTTEKEYKCICNDIIDCHHHVLDTYEKTIQEMTLIPENYVYLDHIKFTSLQIVKCACLNRHEVTKKIDAKFISFLEKDSLSFDMKIVIIYFRIVHFVLRTFRELLKKKAFNKILRERERAHYRLNKIKKVIIRGVKNEKS